ncbi:protein kinase-like domain protein [Phlyctema vagabunda]|uniref:EKC/KEOPS complex subunit BUD32 n=1 Tax=Phlyctema vagabunda TaxID=108571 RepID=A0ABR4PW46_9HELO
MSTATGKSNLLAKGQSGQLILYDKTTVQKIPWHNRTERDLEIEKRAYERLGAHPSILQYKGVVEDTWEKCEGSGRIKSGILLRYHPRGTLRYLIESSRPMVPGETDAVTTPTNTTTTKMTNSPGSGWRENAELLQANRDRWSLQLAEAVVYMHAKNVIHCDISTANILLSDDGSDLVVCDFAGCSLDGCKEFNALAMGRPRCARWYKFLDPGSQHVYGVKEDLFSIGSVLYEMYTGNRIWGGRTDDEKVVLYRMALFPNVMEIEVGDIIRRCWHDCYDTAQDVLDALALIIPQCKVS